MAWTRCRSEGVEGNACASAPAGGISGPCVFPVGGGDPRRCRRLHARDRHESGVFPRQRGPLQLQISPSFPALRNQIERRRYHRHGQMQSSVQHRQMLDLVGVRQEPAIPGQQEVHRIQRRKSQVNRIPSRCRWHQAVLDIVFYDILQAGRLIELFNSSEECSGTSRFLLWSSRQFGEHETRRNQLVIMSVVIPPLAGQLSPGDNLRRRARLKVIARNRGFDVDGSHRQVTIAACRSLGQAVKLVELSVYAGERPDVAMTRDVFAWPALAQRSLRQNTDGI
jgi:hypothetical protein